MSKKKKPRKNLHPNSLKNLRPPWKPGEVPNPGGINRKRPYTDRMFAKGEELLSVSTEGEKIRKKLKLPETARWADAAIQSLAIKAARGDLAAIKELADRIEGK